MVTLKEVVNLIHSYQGLLNTYKYNLKKDVFKNTFDFQENELLSVSITTTIRNLRSIEDTLEKVELFRLTEGLLDNLEKDALTENLQKNIDDIRRLVSISYSSSFRRYEAAYSVYDRVINKFSLTIEEEDDIKENTNYSIFKDIMNS